MQRQKTVAKWLAIILLCTVAVGAYIMYDALYVDGGGQASAGADGGGNETPVPDPEPDPPYYTTLPRVSQSYGGQKVAHAGGEGDDVFCETVFTAQSTLMFFSSDSLEFDCSGEGLYVAVFSDSQLNAVTRFADKGDIVFSKFTADGTVVLTKHSDGNKLRLFDADGRQNGLADFPEFTTAAAYSAGTSTYIFYTDTQGLKCAVLSEGMQLEKSAFYLPETDHSVVETFPVAGGVLLFTATSEGNVAIVRFTQKQGFSIQKVYTNTELLQIVPLAGEEGTAYAMLGKTADGGVLTVLNAEGAQEASAALGSLDGAVIFSDGISVTLVRSGVTETYCRHLDLISSKPNSVNFGKVLYVRNSQDARLFAVSLVQSTEIYMLDGSDELKSLVSLPAQDVEKLTAAVRGGSVDIAFSTAYAQDVCYQNFGKSDCFLLSVNIA